MHPPQSEEYFDGLPAWFVRVAHPARFKDAAFKVDFRVFLMDRGALIAAAVRFFDVPENPVLFHRVFDPGLPEALEYLQKLADGEDWTFIFKSSGKETAVVRMLDPDPKEVEACLGEACKHIWSIKSLNSASCLDAFNEVYEAAAAEGPEAAWARVEKRLCSRKVPQAEKSPSCAYLLAHLKELAKKAEAGFPPSEAELASNEPPIIVRLVDAILAYALDRRSPEVRLVQEADAAFVELEEGDAVHSILGLSKMIGRASSARLKIMSLLDIAEKRRAQTGSLDARHPGTGKLVRAAVSTVHEGGLETVRVSFR